MCTRILREDSRSRSDVDATFFPRSQSKLGRRKSNSINIAGIEAFN